MDSVDLRTVADQLGVHYQTAYRWVRDGALEAVKHGGVYHVSPDELERFQAARSVPAPPPARASVRSWEPYVERLYEALAAGDEQAGRAVVERLHGGGIDVVTLCTHLFTPALRRLGEAWARGRVGVAEEHRASAMCTRLLARVAPHPRGRPRGTAVVTTTPAEAHELPGLMASMALRADRWRVHHLGTQVPYEHLADLARVEGADVVVLSVTHGPAEREARRYAARIEDDLGVRALVGSPGAPLTDLLDAART